MSLISKLVGKKVIIYSVAGGVEKQDVGLLEAADEHFIQLKKTETETLYFQVSLIRIVKPFEFG